jgi:hypothetical protein
VSKLPTLSRKREPSVQPTTQLRFSGGRFPGLQNTVEVDADLQPLRGLLMPGEGEIGRVRKLWERIVQTQADLASFDADFRIFDPQRYFAESIINELQKTPAGSAQFEKIVGHSYQLERDYDTIRNGLDQETKSKLFAIEFDRNNRGAYANH